jgi:hypothetical protein
MTLLVYTLQYQVYPFRVDTVYNWNIPVVNFGTIVTVTGPEQGRHQAAADSKLDGAAAAAAAGAAVMNMTI